MPEKEKWSEEKIEEMLSREKSVELRVERALEGFKHPFTALVLIEAKDYAGVKVRVLQKYSDFEIIYITLNESYQKIWNDCEKQGRDCSKIFFIDLVSVEAGRKTPQMENVAYIDSPSDLTETIVLAEKKLEESLGKKTLLFLDSISTMLIYNNPPAVEKFMHTLLGRVNSMGASAIVLSADFDEKDQITSIVGQFFEKTIKA